MKRDTTIIVLCTLFLSCLGVLQVYSVSAVRLTIQEEQKTTVEVPGANASSENIQKEKKEEEKAPPTFLGITFSLKNNLFIKHCLFFAVGLAAFIILSHMDYHVLGSRRGFRIVVLLSILLLGIVLLPGIGVKVGGARRWINLGPLGGFQPSEFAKLALIVLLSVKLTQNQESVRRSWRGMIPPFCIALFFAGLVAAERDIGIPVVMMATAFLMVFVSGGSVPILSGIAALGVGGLTAMIYFFPHRMVRIRAFLDPWDFRKESGWQLIQSLSAFAQGGLLGKGGGAGEQKLGYLPAAHTDFIFATIGEEYGLIGSLIVVTIFLILTFAAIRVAMNAPDLFGALLATGICTMITFQAAFIIAVNIGMLPTKGLPLPFVSSGGTALMIYLAMAGILTNIGAQARESTTKRRTPAISQDRRKRAVATAA